MKRSAVLILIAGLSWFACQSAERHDAFVIPIDTRHAHTPDANPVFGMYIVDHPASQSQTDSMISGDLKTYAEHLPYVLVTTAWADGHMSWATATDLTEYSISHGSTTAKAVLATRDRLLARMEDMQKLSSMATGPAERRVVLFAKSGEKYQVIRAGLDVAYPDHVRAAPSGVTFQEPDAEFRKQWAEVRALLTACVPEQAEPGGADWLQFTTTTP